MAEIIDDKKINAEIGAEQPLAEPTIVDKINGILSKVENIVKIISSMRKNPQEQTQIQNPQQEGNKNFKMQNPNNPQPQVTIDSTKLDMLIADGLKNLDKLPLGKFKDKKLSELLTEKNYNQYKNFILNFLIEIIKKVVIIK